MRFTSLAHLSRCSPMVKAQLEKHVDAMTASERAADPETNKRRERPEEAEGKVLVKWMDMLVLKDGLKPGLFFAHVPNGGARSDIEAAILKGQGVRAGWPDYILALPRQGYHGLMGELKAPNAAKPGKEQLDILQRLETVRYKVCVWWSFEDAKRDISKYLDLAR